MFRIGYNLVAFIGAAAGLHIGVTTHPLRNPTGAFVSSRPEEQINFSNLFTLIRHGRNLCSDSRTRFTALYETIDSQVLDEIGTSSFDAQQFNQVWMAYDMCEAIEKLLDSTGEFASYDLDQFMYDRVAISCSFDVLHPDIVKGYQEGRTFRDDDLISKCANMIVAQVGKWWIPGDVDSPEKPRLTKFVALLEKEGVPAEELKSLVGI